VKRCSKCGEVKALTEYYAAKGCRDGLRGDCKACFAARAKARYAEKSEEIKAYVKRWQQENSEHVRAYRKRRRQEIRGLGRDAYLKRTFGISIEDFETMLAAQGGGCAICGRAAPEGSSLHVDHDHETGVVRGLLCFTCNGALGMFTENEDFLVRAADYVNRGGFAASGAPEMVELARSRAAALVPAGRV
jgi:hypothetical protein